MAHKLVLVLQSIEAVITLYKTFQSRTILYLLLYFVRISHIKNIMNLKMK
jgi:hypothetical protein